MNCSDVRFFIGLHQPPDARHFEQAFISVNRLRTRKSAFDVGEWIMDSGAFTEIAKYGCYRHSVAEYASEIRRWRNNGTLLAAVAQDYMCEPMMLKRTGLSVREHQRSTIERFDDLQREDCGGVYVMPVLQGYEPCEYRMHLQQYGARLSIGAWVGVGSVCKRNAKPDAIERVLWAIKTARPDVRLHGFGLKRTALTSPLVRALLYSADSMAWSAAARREGRNANSWAEAARFCDEIERAPRQLIAPGCVL